MADTDPSQDWRTLEWIESNLTGSFALGSVDRIPRRKYHALLTVREPGFGDPLNVLVETGETISIGDKTFLLHNFRFGNQVYPQGFQHLVGFQHRPLPTWEYRLGDLKLTRRLELDSVADTVRITYRFEGVSEPMGFQIEPHLACRPVHRLTKENPFINGATRTEGDTVFFHPYEPLPRFAAKISGVTAQFAENPRWDKGMFYETEWARGYEAAEDLFCPGDFRMAIKDDCELTFSFGVVNGRTHKNTSSPKARFATGKDGVREKCEYAGSHFLITKKSGFHSIVAGYPWFDDWARDTMIAMPGLCLATGNTAKARQILESHANAFMKAVIQTPSALSGIQQNVMLDAPLLFVRAVQMLAEDEGPNAVRQLMPAVYHVLNSLKNGVDSRVKVTPDLGVYVEPGPYAMTWMDAMVNGQPVTPRHGYAVDIDALMFNAVSFAVDWSKSQHNDHFAREWEPMLKRAESAFIQRFWLEAQGHLADCHSGSAPDFSLRPNQLWATALPYTPLTDDMAKRVIEKVRTELVTPVGLRTLAPSDSRYIGTYRGSQRDRDLAYHQGAVWPWLLGIYADSLLNYYGIDRVRTELEPILQRIEKHIDQEGCLGQVSELFEGSEPHQPAGAPAQAWSVAELLRILAMLEIHGKRVK